MQRRSGRRHMTQPANIIDAPPRASGSGRVVIYPGPDWDADRIARAATMAMRLLGPPPGGWWTLVPAKRAAARKRLPTLASVVKQAKTAGIDIARARIEIKADRTIVIVPGQGVPAEAENPWRAEFQRKENKK